MNFDWTLNYYIDLILGTWEFVSGVILKHKALWSGAPNSFAQPADFSLIRQNYRFWMNRFIYETKRIKAYYKIKVTFVHSIKVILCKEETVADDKMFSRLIRFGNLKIWFVYSKIHLYLKENFTILIKIFNLVGANKYCIR